MYALCCLCERYVYVREVYCKVGFGGGVCMCVCVCVCMCSYGLHKIPFYGSLSFAFQRQKV